MYKLAEPEDKSVPITFFGAISSTSQANKNQFLLYDEEGIVMIYFNIELLVGP